MPDRLNEISPSELRRQRAQQRERADASLRASKRRERSPHHEIEAGLSKAADVGRLGRRVAALVGKRKRAYVDALKALLTHLDHCRSPLLDDDRYVVAIGALAEYAESWFRPPAEWKPRTHNAGRQFSSLARHLLAKYPVPPFFDAAWLDPSDPKNERKWFVHVGAGHNMRMAGWLPFPLTKMMAHHVMHAPDDLSVLHALRWGQVRGVGGSERLARAVVGTRVATRQGDEPFWLTVFQFLAANPMLDPHQVGPIVDYLHAQRFERAPDRIVNGRLVHGEIPQPNLSMKGRTVASLLRQVQGWHRALHRSVIGKHLAWPSCGIPGYDRVEGTPPDQRLFTITELLSGGALHEEGRDMSHCVGSYAYSCERGHCAIYSLREDSGRGPQRRLTIEVIVQNKRIVQARARHNRPPSGVDDRILRAWATAAGLSIAPLSRM